MGQLVKYFLRGLLIIVPIAVTLYLVYAIVTSVDHIVSLPEAWGGDIPGLGLLLVLGGTCLVGWLGSNYFMRSLVGWLDRTLAALPLVKLLYTSIRDLVNAFVGDKKSFDRPVIARLSEHGEVHVLGFVTRDDLSELGLDTLIGLYLPQSYNFAGNLILLPRKLVRPLDVDAAKVMTFIVSGGVSGHDAPPSLERGQKHS